MNINTPNIPKKKASTNDFIERKGMASKVTGIQYIIKIIIVIRISISISTVLMNIK